MSRYPVEWLRNVPDFVRQLDGPTPCAGSSTHDGDGTRTQQRTACAVCAPCPARQACALWALTHPTEAGPGIWGGLTEEDRQAMRSRTVERRNGRAWHPA